MKKEDLRIGNIVRAVIERDTDVTEIVAAVSQIAVNGVYLSGIKNDTGIRFEYKDIHPISLTKELYDKIEEENKSMVIPSIYVEHTLDWFQNIAYFINGREIKIERSWI